MYRPLPVETIDRIITYSLSNLDIHPSHVGKESYYRAGWEHLALLGKVCKSWNAVATSRLYAKIGIFPSCTGYSRYIFFLCKTLNFDPSLCDLVKELRIEDYAKRVYKRSGVELHYEGVCQKLLRLCMSASRVTVKGWIPTNPRNMRNILIGRKLRELTLDLHANDTFGPNHYLFTSGLEMIRFVTLLRDIECITFGSDLCPDPRNSGYDETDVKGYDSDSEKPYLEMKQRYIIPRLVSSKTLPLVKLDLYDSALLVDDSLELLSGLNLPHLRNFQINFLGSDSADNYVLKCLTGFPTNVEVLRVRREGDIRYFSNRGPDFVNALDRFSSLRELHISGNLDIDLFHVLNKPTLTSATYCQRILTNEEMKDLTSKLEQTIRGVSQDGAFAYVPLLDDLSIYS